MWQFNMQCKNYEYGFLKFPFNMLGLWMIKSRCYKNHWNWKYEINRENNKIKRCLFLIIIEVDKPLSRPREIEKGFWLLVSDKYRTSLQISWTLKNRLWTILCVKIWQPRRDEQIHWKIIWNTYIRRNT